MRIATDGPLTPAAMTLLTSAQAEVLTIGRHVLWSQLTHDCDAFIYSGSEPLPKDIFRDRGRLIAIASTGQDKNPVDLDAATRAGILVLEPARGESASVADFALFTILDAARNRAGGAVELYGKTLGLLGFGQTATAVAQRAKSFGLKTLVWDEDISRGRSLLYDAEPTDMVDLLVTSDFIVNLLPLTENNRQRFGKDELQLIKKDGHYIHLADLSLLRWEEIIQVLDLGFFENFTIDLPAGRDDLQKDLLRFPSVRATVNESSNTKEARQAIYLEMAGDVLCVLQGDEVETAVNLPYLRAIERRKQAPWFDLAQMLGIMLGTRLGKLPTQVDLFCGGEAQSISRDGLTRAFAAGLASSLGETSINRISGALWARECGVELRWHSATNEEDQLICQAGAVRGKRIIGGTVRHMRPQIVRLDDYHFTADPTEHLLLIPHANRPGLVGQAGTLLGNHKVNIRGMVLGQKNQTRDTALMWIMLDQAPSPQLIAQLSKETTMMNPEYIHIPMNLS